MTVQIQLRRDTAANWTSANPTLSSGEAGYETDTHKLKFGDGSTAWASLAYYGFTNPMTTQDDIIVGGSSGVPARLAKGSDSQVLTVDPSTHHLVWANASSGFSNPMTTRGDIIIENSSPAPARLAVGGANTVLKSNGTDPAWGSVLPADIDITTDNTTSNATTGHHGFLLKLGGGTTNFLRADGTWASPGGGSSPLTTKGDIWGFSSVDARVPVGSNGQVLTADSTQTLGIKWAAGGGGGSAVTSASTIHTSVDVSAAFITAIWEAQGSGTLSGSVIADATGGAVFLNIFLNNVRQEQLTASGGSATYTFSTFSVAANDQVYMTISNGGGAKVSGGSFGLSAGLVNLGAPIAFGNPIS